MARSAAGWISPRRERWSSKLPDQSDHPSPGPDTLVIRAAFVPDGEQPPPEFMADFSPLHIRATRDPATGEITCDNAGGNFDGDILAEWHPDQYSDVWTDQDIGSDT